MSQNPSKAPPKSELHRLKKLSKIEAGIRAKGFYRIAGVDEAGRGPLAGPVVAAACIFKKPLIFPGINDSKLLRPTRRTSLFEKITSHDDVIFGVGIVEHSIIDTINILQATLKAMRQAVEELKERPDYLLVDGVHLDFENIAAERLIKGDSRSQLVAAASIIAKETRDRIMVKYHGKYPEYGFDEHKGYGTEKHRQALKKYGPCPIHRLSFAPLLLK